MPREDVFERPWIVRVLYFNLVAFSVGNLIVAQTTVSMFPRPAPDPANRPVAPYCKILPGLVPDRNLAGPGQARACIGMSLANVGLSFRYCGAAAHRFGPIWPKHHQALAAMQKRRSLEANLALYSVLRAGFRAQRVMPIAAKVPGQAKAPVALELS